ncbi:MAG: amino acid ABC transporter permease [Proteobacteria bacterium]|nr:amino acid ABC transporter permease [Pseudomonadota bacterium]
MLSWRDAFTLPKWPTAHPQANTDASDACRLSPGSSVRGRHSAQGEGEKRRASAWFLFAIFALIVGGTSFALAQAGAQPKAGAIEVIVKWAPLLLWGFFFNILISVVAMAIGTVAGVPLGMGQIALSPLVRWPARVATQLFRNSPWLVLLFLCVFLIPFEIRIGSWRIPFPDWAKAIFGFSLPVMANTSEIVRGAIQSVATGQWEGAAALGLTRRMTLYLVILPQCIKRMLPPWMNLYSLIAMSTVNASIVGVSEMVTLVGQVQSAEGSRPELLAPLYGFVLVCFFLYCYPIGKWTVALERRYGQKL